MYAETAGLDDRIKEARAAQGLWRTMPIRARLTVIRRFRQLLARDATRVAGLIPESLPRRPGETLSAEILPILEACRFLEREAERLLRARRLGRRGRPIWLSGLSAEIRREPFGVVLILGPGNYPILLPGVQIIQALAAGNAVLIKPAPGCRELTMAAAELLFQAGLPRALLLVVEETLDAAEAALTADIDKVILTGGAHTGRAVLRRLADRIVPAVMELSGNDAVLVLPGADLDLVADALVFGLRFNGSQTCLAPRRVITTDASFDQLAATLSARLGGLPPDPAGQTRRPQIDALVDEAVAMGATRLGSDAGTVLLNPPHGSAVLREDLFGPVLSIIRVTDLDEAVAVANEGPYGLGAAIFGPEPLARGIAALLDVGSVCINDLIVPTADPRLPFGGRRHSGFGVTRGAEGLLEMTAIKTVSVRTGRLRPHLKPQDPTVEPLFAAFLQAAHGRGLRQRAGALGRVIRAGAIAIGRTA